MSHQASFDFYGTTIRVQSKLPSCLTVLETEFHYFKSELSRPEFSVELIATHPTSGLLPEAKAASISQNSVTYDVGPVRWNDYHGQALSYYDDERKQGVIWSADPDLLHEIAYLMILSLTGKALDKRGFHKLHACGVRYMGRDMLIMMPSMGGKTTLFLELAQHPGVHLLSDDTPIMGPDGKLHPFPLRLGVEKLPAHLGHLKVSKFKRQHHSTKFLIPLSELGTPIAQGVGGSPVLIFGKRWSGHTPHAHKLSPLESLHGLMEHMVVGVGLPMVIEYFVKHTLRDWCVLVGIGLSRLRSALRLWQQGDSWEVLLSQDSKANARLILSLVSKK